MALSIKTFRITDAAGEDAVNQFLQNKRVHHWEASYNGDPSLGMWNLLIAYEEDHRRPERNDRGDRERSMQGSGRRMEPRPAAAAPARMETPPDVPKELMGMYENVRKWRNQVARDEKIKPYVLFNNKQLEDMVKAPPTTSEALKAVASDMTPELFGKYSNQLLGLISAASAGTAAASSEPAA